MCKYCKKEHDSRIACEAYAKRGKCQCKEIMWNFSGREPRIYAHLSGCPESEWALEYEALPWYKKLFTGNPKHIYDLHKNQTRTR